MRRLVCVLMLAGGVLRAQTAAPVNVYDGFEGPKLSELWESGRFTAGAIEMQSAVVRAGHGAVKITVHANDVFEAGQNGNADSERDECSRRGGWFRKRTCRVSFRGACSCRRIFRLCR